jgi:hypothetical protein
MWACPVLKVHSRANALNFTIRDVYDRRMYKQFGHFDFRAPLTKKFSQSADSSTERDDQKSAGSGGIFRECREALSLGFVRGCNSRSNSISLR